MKEMKKAASMILALMMTMSSGCSFPEQEKEEEIDYSEDVLAVAEDFCAEIKELDIKKAVKISGEDVAEDLTALEPSLSFEEGEIYSADGAQVAAAVAATLDYTIDEDSLECSKKKPKGSVDVNFTISDPSFYTEEIDYHDIDEVLADVESAETKTVSITLYIEQNDDEDWEVTDCGKLTDDVFFFAHDMQFDFVSPLVGIYTETVWEGCDEDYGDGVYTNSAFIGFVVGFDVSVPLEFDTMSYAILQDGEVLFSHDVIIYDEQTQIDENSVIIFITTFDRGVPLSPDGQYIDEGNYTVEIYSNGDVVYSTDVTCYLEEEPDYFDLESTVGNLEFDGARRPELLAAVDRDRSGWYQDGEQIGGEYPADTANASLRLYVSEDFGPLGYVIYISEEAEVLVPLEDNMSYVSMSESEVSVDEDGALYYDFSMDESLIRSGYYVFIVSDSYLSDSEADFLLLACCSIE